MCGAAPTLALIGEGAILARRGSGPRASQRCRLPWQSFGMTDAANRIAADLAAGEPLHPVADVLRDLGVEACRDTIWRWVKDAGLPATRAGGRWRTTRSAAIEWLARGDQEVSR